MSNKLIESFSNIYKKDEAKISQGKAFQSQMNISSTPRGYSNMLLTSDSTMNAEEPSMFYEEHMQGHPADKKHSHNDIEECYSPVSSLSFEENKNYIDYFSLPKFGLCEKSCQTNLTGRDLDELDYISKEFALFRNDFLSSLMKGRQSEALKRLFPFLDDFKLLNKPTENLDDLSEEKTKSHNFVQIKRRADNEWTNSRDRDSHLKNLHSSNWNSFSEHSNPHFHIKGRQSKGGRRRKKQEDSELHNSKETMKENNFYHEIKEFNPEISSTPTKKDFNYDDDISGIINHIKNSSSKNERKLDVIDSDAQEKTHFEDSANSGKDRLGGINKKLNVRKFDAYQFFKAEYIISHKDLTEDELERSCRDEWNCLEKEVKKLYNMNAERERKNHKLIKRNQMKESKHTSDH